MKETGGIIMFDIEIRRHILVSNYGIKPYFAERIISQEKSMIEQAKKEAREDLVDKLKLLGTEDAYGNLAVFKFDIDKLLK
jgi:hypothetical protein